MYNYAKFQMAPHYRGNHVLIPMGCDFSYSNARMTFHSTDRLIEYFNSHITDATIMYSTPSEYLSALKSQNLTWPLKYDDMFPYADQAEDFWSGYFSSRANAKKQVRDAQAALHGSQKMMTPFMLGLTQQTRQEQKVREKIVERKEQMMDALGVY
jgi:lysosomal alpha-mannosidase